jgi:hypothetical protein
LCGLVTLLYIKLEYLSRSLKQFDDIAIGIFQQNLLAAWTCYYVVSKTYAFLFQLRDKWLKFRDLEYKSIPTTRFWLPTVGHRPRRRALRSGKPQR